MVERSLTGKAISVHYGDQEKLASFFCWGALGKALFLLAGVCESVLGGL
jgi:hypothetical protein